MLNGGETVRRKAVLGGAELAKLMNFAVQVDYVVLRVLDDVTITRTWEFVATICTLDLWRTHVRESLYTSGSTQFLNMLLKEVGYVVLHVWDGVANTLRDSSCTCGSTQFFEYARLVVLLNDDDIVRLDSFAMPATFVWLTHALHFYEWLTHALMVLYVLQVCTPVCVSGLHFC